MKGILINNNNEVIQDLDVSSDDNIAVPVGYSYINADVYEKAKLLLGGEAEVFIAFGLADKRPSE